MPMFSNMRVFFKKGDHTGSPLNNHNISLCLVDKLQFMLFYRRETPPLSFNLNKPYTSIGQDASNIGVPVSGLPDGFLHVAAFEGERADKPALDTVLTPVDSRWFDSAHV